MTEKIALNVNVPDEFDHPDYYRKLLLLKGGDALLEATILAAAQGYDVVEFTDREAFELAKTEPFALAVLTEVSESGESKVTTIGSKGDSQEMNVLPGLEE